MSVGPSGPIVGGAAGTPAAETHGPQSDRVRQEVAAGERRADSDQKADAAAGIAGPDGEDLETEDRDGDGRSPWTQHPTLENVDSQGRDQAAAPPAKDGSRSSGNLLDLNG